MHKSNQGFSLIELSIVILIIGILIAGIVQGSKILESSKLKTARSLTNSSPVAGIKDLVAWWETTSENSFIESEAEDATKVSIWKDLNPRSIIKINPPQDTDGNKPIYTENAISGLPALYFNGTTSHFELPYDRMLNQDTFTIFAVITAQTKSDYCAIFSSRHNSPRTGYALYMNDTKKYEALIATGSNWGGGTATETVVRDVPDILTMRYDGSNLNVYDGGSSIISTATAFGPNTSKTFRIGAGYNESATPLYYFKGYIGEIIIFGRALKEEERKAVEKYLSQKWKISVS